MDHKLFTDTILKWYQQNKRDLPWRRTKDPFKIWLSEVIMQQTRVNQGLPYYRKFDARFDTVKDLASATEEEVLQLWEGLGYYSRGRNLLAGARVIVSDFDGKMPKSYQELLKIKGIGKYTAGAIASIAYGEPVPAVDGNVHRVLSRVFGIEEDLAYSSGIKKLTEVAEKVMNFEDPGSHNQAIMEFGATVCTPRNPDCHTCMFMEHCYAFAQNKQQELPFKSKKTKKKNRYLNYVLFSFGDEFLLKKRSDGDIWQGLYDFHVLNEDQQLLSEEEIIREVNNMGSGFIFKSSKDYRHILSHQEINARINLLETRDKQQLSDIGSQAKLRKFSLNEIGALPKPVLINKYLNDEIF